ncbi:Retrotransposon Tca5 Polyprotein [Phytophthora palmivora]|uniref:Retrotransposon Tca5 Polyprotein n=1 Tax=Phytophthora palmivora TaxID=4796 RepID=A0A2P4XFX2_9STRA|nr:Retrotransposon Tca5 Polyprotein [Phytophthora palmivora]
MTPQVRGLTLEPETKMSAKQPSDYRGIVGSLLQCLVCGTRPDIANAAREHSMLLSCYNRTHWDVARRVLKYLKGSSTYGLFPDGKTRDVTYGVYPDASLACQTKERKYVTGYVIKMAGTTMSRAEAEHISLSEGAKESERLWDLLSEMGFLRKVQVQVWRDSNAAVSIVKNPGTHKANKPIEIRYLFTSNLVELGRFNLAYCATTAITVYTFTKALPTKQFLNLREKVGVRDLELNPST